MHLFEVTSWGNSEDGFGGNGPDTNYLVCARDHEEAAALVRDRGRSLAQIFELGLCSFEPEGPLVLRGPYLEPAIPRGVQYTRWVWDGELEVWVGDPFCRDGMATCRYPNGQLAAEIAYRDGHRLGPRRTWYPDGRLMHREERHWLGQGGVNESWYADGVLASRFAYAADGGGQYAYYDRSGRLVEEGRLKNDSPDR